MDRLQKDIDHIVSDGIDSAELYKRVCRYLRELARYRDTGLEPEKIMRLCEMEKRSRMAKMLRWEEAERAGRLVVLTCKVGDAVWYITSALEICEAEITGIWLNAYTRPQMWLEIKYCSKMTGEHEYKSRIDLLMGKTVFLTREEAEAALEKQKGGGEG